MSEAIITAIVSGAVTLLVCLINNHYQQSRTTAVIEVRLDELTREVREHNGFARRMPVVEEQIRGIDHRVQHLEGGCMK